MFPALLSWLSVRWPGHCRALQDRRQSRESCGKIPLQGCSRSAAAGKSSGGDPGVAGRLRLRLPAVNVWPGFQGGGGVLRRGSATEPQEGSGTVCAPASHTIKAGPPPLAGRLH